MQAETQERICKTTDDLPFPNFQENGFSLYRGYYKLGCTWHDADSNETKHEDGGFVLGHGNLWLAVNDTDKSNGIGWTKEEAIKAAKTQAEGR